MIDELKIPLHTGVGYSSLSQKFLERKVKRSPMIKEATEVCAKGGKSIRRRRREVKGNVVDCKMSKLVSCAFGSGVYRVDFLTKVRCDRKDEKNAKVMGWRHIVVRSPSMKW